MLMRRRGGRRGLPMAAAVLAAGGAVVAVPAAADDRSWLDRVECGRDENGAGCEIGLRWERDGGAAEPGGDPAPPSASPAPSPAPSPAGEPLPAPSAPPAPPEGVGVEVQYPEDPAPPGGAVVEVVTVTVVVVEVVTVAGTPAPSPSAAPSGADAALETADSFELPDPRIGTSPGGGAPVLVNTPLWLWVEEPGTRTAEAEVPGLSVSLTAVPDRVRWRTGDGGEEVCAGPGTPFDPEVHDPASASPDCGHAYASASEPGGTFSLTAEVTWDVTWESSDGATGVLDAVTTSATTEVEVEESQGLVTGAG